MFPSKFFTSENAWRKGPQVRAARALHRLLRLQGRTAMEWIDKRAAVNERWRRVREAKERTALPGAGRTDSASDE